MSIQVVYMVHFPQGVIATPGIQSEQRQSSAGAGAVDDAALHLAVNLATSHNVAQAAPQPDGVEYRLGIETVESSFGAQSPIARKMRHFRAVSAAIRASTVPLDKESFRQDVRRHLIRSYGHDESFQQALRNGTLIIYTTDEVPELNFQPLIKYALYRDGVEKGAGEFSPPGFDDLRYQQLGRDRNQSKGQVGLHQYYAWWPK